MTQNTVAKAMRVMGVCIIVIGIIGAFCGGYVFPAVTYNQYGRADTSYNWELVIILLVGTILSGTLFIAISEIIRLLQASVDKLDKITRSVNDRVEAGSDTKQGVVRDIESNLPEI